MKRMTAIMFLLVFMAVFFVCSFAQAQPSKDWVLIKKIALEQGINSKADPGNFIKLFYSGSTTYCCSYNKKNRTITFFVGEGEGVKVYITSYCETSGKFDEATYANGEIIKKEPINRAMGLEDARLFINDLGELGFL